MAVIVDAADHDQEVLSATLVERLVCTIDHADLRLAGRTLVCERCDRVYPIEDRMPNMVIDGE